MAKVSDPLNGNHLKLLNKIIQDGAQIADYCNRCASCGIDVDREARKNAEQVEIARKLKAKFFPNER